MKKTSIKRIIGTGLLIALLGSGVELGIYEHLFDHTKGACILSHIPGIGVQHQGRAMEREMKKQGWNITTYALSGDNENNPLDVNEVSVYYNYKPLEGMEDATNLLNNYQEHISVRVK